MIDGFHKKCHKARALLTSKRPQDSCAFGFKIKPKLYALLTLLMSLTLVSQMSAQDIGYTVQVMALSDELKALQLQSDLAAQGHPAYLLTVPTEQGTVYRLRIGSFANREAAVQYAKEMTPLADSEPSPALAESIPQHLIPLAPELILSLPLAESSLQVMAWRDGLVLRNARSQTLSQAEYTVIDGPTFKAWRAFPQSDGTGVRVYSRPLWPDDFERVTEDERAAFAAGIISELATELGLSAEQVSSFTFEGEPPFLVVAEQFNELTGERNLLKALGQPLSELGPKGPDLQWFADEGVTLTEPEPLFDLAFADASQELLLLDSWRAVADGDYTRLESLDGQKTWRAVAGRPLWAGGDILIADNGDDVLVYRLLTRQ